MKTTIDVAARIIVPKVLREQCVEIEPATKPMSLIKRGGGRVAVPSRRLPPLTDEIVRDTLERTRR